MSQHDAGAAGPAVTAGDGAEVSEPRTARRRMLVWLAVPAAIAFGTGVGYLAAEAWTPTGRPPAATAPGHSGHEATAAQSHDGEQAPGGHDTHDPVTVADEHGAGHDSASAPAVADGSTGHDASGGHEEPAAVDRPRTAVLTGFAAVNAAVLLTAAVLRRRSPRPTRRTTAARTA